MRIAALTAVAALTCAAGAAGAPPDARDAARAVRKVDRLFRDYDPTRPDARDMERRRAALAALEEARAAALERIFDVEAYADADHGRSGQAAVDAAVARVAPIWRAVDRLQRRDLGKLLRLEPAEAAELLAALRAAPADAAELAPPGWRALLAARAGEAPAGDDLDPWGAALLRRLADERVRVANRERARGAPDDAGVAPTAAEVEEVRLTNDYRLLLGRRALALDLRLVASARGHSEDMARGGFFAHESPVPGKTTATDRMEAAGHPAPGGENIYRGGASAAAAHRAWLHSPGHHRNILRPGYRAIGVGRAGDHWTQNFGRASGRR